MKASEVFQLMEQVAPLAYQDGFDNAGLQVGYRDREVTGVMVSLDLMPCVLEEARREGCNVILTHHPLLFRTPKTLTGRTETERMVMRALEWGISVYSAHTNLDNAPMGVNHEMASRLGLVNTRILQPRNDALWKFCAFLPSSCVDAVRKALSEAGCGSLGGYQGCCYLSDVSECYIPGEDSNPAVGEPLRESRNPSVRLEMIVPGHLRSEAERILRSQHPYEVPAYDFIKVEGPDADYGSGMIGDLKEEMSQEDFLALVKEVFHVSRLAHSPLYSSKVRRVALCGGAGSFLIPEAIRQKADVFLTGEISYHEFFDRKGRILLAAAGHYETEQFTQDLIERILKERFPDLKVQRSLSAYNPVSYI